MGPVRCRRDGSGTPYHPPPYHPASVPGYIKTPVAIQTLAGKVGIVGVVHAISPAGRQARRVECRAGMDPHWHTETSSLSEEVQGYRTLQARRGAIGSPWRGMGMARAL